ncbi:hypothetical protein [Staphylococcus cohnii]|uniref:hypothetical protein n=1 Tax=Staphylococcus cohnii TaxID=29382 RepID=UPI001F4623B6|nr:hypothetical protein [Staphylococcus cohnii]
MIKPNIVNMKSSNFALIKKPLKQSAAGAAMMTAIGNWFSLYKRQVFLIKIIAINIIKQKVAIYTVNSPKTGLNSFAVSDITPIPTNVTNQLVFGKTVPLLGNIR